VSRELPAALGGSDRALHAALKRKDFVATVLAKALELPI
jgi:hypothetical protein